MKRVCTPSLSSHFRTGFAVNLGLLSERMYSGIPLVMNRSASLSMTRWEVIFLFHGYGRALPGKFVDNIQHSEGSPIMSP